MVYKQPYNQYNTQHTTLIYLRKETTKKFISLRLLWRFNQKTEDYTSEKKKEKKDKGHTQHWDSKQQNRPKGKH